MNKTKLARGSIFFHNLLFYALLSYWAIRIVPRFKALLFLVALSPMSLHQAAPFSYDAFVNALSFLLFALLLRAILTDKPWDGRAFVTALVHIIQIGTIK